MWGGGKGKGRRRGSRSRLGAIVRPTPRVLWVGRGVEGKGVAAAAFSALAFYWLYLFSSGFFFFWL